MKQWIKRIGFGVALALLAHAGWADEASVKKALLGKYSNLPQEIVVKKTEIGNLYEVNLLGIAAYTNEKTEFLLVGGSLINGATLEDWTAKRKPQLQFEFARNLPLKHALKTVYGKGERTLITFEDPDCPLCQEQHAVFKKLGSQLNATVYTFMFPLAIHPDAERKANFIMCQANPAAAWRAWMEDRKGLPLDAVGNLSLKATSSCPADGAVKAGSKLARDLGYHETPRFIFENGWGANGALSAEQVMEGLRAVQENVTALKAAASPKNKDK